MVDFDKLKDQAKDAFDKHRDKVEDLAEKGVAKYEERTGKQAPSQVTDAIDRIDPTDDADAERVDVEDIHARPNASGAGQAPSQPREMVNTTPKRV